MFYHGELANLKPAPRYLTRFYLMVSLGGALGGVVRRRRGPVGVRYLLRVRHRAGRSRGLLAAYLLWPLPKWIPAGRAWRRRWPPSTTCTNTSYDLKRNTRLTMRNFYGTLRVQADRSATTSPRRVRRLMHGVIMHGEQYLRAEAAPPADDLLRPGLRHRFGDSPLRGSSRCASA